MILLEEIHLNDEASIGFSSDSIGCYCDFCKERFKGLFSVYPPLEKESDLDLWLVWNKHRVSEWTRYIHISGMK